jgi:hypothetical protein
MDAQLIQLGFGNRRHQELHAGGCCGCYGTTAGAVIDISGGKNEIRSIITVVLYQLTLDVRNLCGCK